MHGVTKDVILSSGGAYSGVSKAMLLAGGNKQTDATLSEVHNSSNQDHWMKLGDNCFANTNNGDSLTQTL